MSEILKSSDVQCENCQHCIITEDRSEEMYPPFAHCSKNHEIVNLDIMEWIPKSKTCIDFTIGEPTYY
jgi:hypothetical protein